ncbi:hypothetical protein P1059_01433 [Pasteurella multocida subsp. gallicida P1059]|nr:hypothetical protein P1059_01433 [Pasteurella multocida subsp. gallicida P1059]
MRSVKFKMGFPIWVVGTFSFVFYSIKSAVDFSKIYSAL